LADAFASVDWAASRCKSLARRVDEWLKHNVSDATVKSLPEGPNDLVVVSSAEPPPLFFNVEVGAYINAMRSALDLLATSLAHRFGMPNPDNIYFPVADRRERFLANDFVKLLPDAERGIIESIAPYRGGNPLLWSLHRLDITRKHKRLLVVDVRPRTFSIWGWGKVDDYFTPLATGWIAGVDGEIGLGVIKKGAPMANMKFKPHVTIDEADLGRMPVGQALDGFARVVRSVIVQFDTR
jgi:hypothetical protein